MKVEPRDGLGSQRAARGATPSPLATTSSGQQGPQVSGSGSEAPKVFIDAQALLLKIVKHPIEPQLHMLDAPITVTSELQRRGEDLNLRRQDLTGEASFEKKPAALTPLPPLHY